jgi:sugar phosphate isomerase/epimerase
MWCSSIVLEDYPVEDAFRLMREAGFTRVDPWKHHLKRCKTPELRQLLVKYASGLGLEMGGLNVVGETYFQPFGTDQELQGTLDGLKADLDLALSLGIHDVLIWEGVRPAGMSDLDCETRLLPRLEELFRACIKFAEPDNARFLVEPHPFTVGMNDRLLAKLYDALDSDHFGITYDCCHFGVGQPDDYIGVISRLGPRIRNIHFSDSDRRTSELHYSLGTGRLDLQGILEGFKAISYNGTLMLDIYGNPIPLHAMRESVPMLRHAYNYLDIKH